MHIRTRNSFYSGHPCPIGWIIYFRKLVQKSIKMTIKTHIKSGKFLFSLLVLYSNERYFALKILKYFISAMYICDFFYFKQTKHLQSSRMAWEYRHARALLLHHYCILNTILCIYRLVIHKRKSFEDKYHMIYGIWINSIQMFCLFSLDSYKMKANINSVLFASWTNCLSLEFLQCFFFLLTIYVSVGNN